MKQVRIPTSELPRVMINVANATMSWQDALDNYPVQDLKEEEVIEPEKPVE